MTTTTKKITNLTRRARPTAKVTRRQTALTPVTN